MADAVQNKYTQGLHSVVVEVTSAPCILEINNPIVTLSLFDNQIYILTLRCDSYILVLTLMFTFPAPHQTSPSLNILMLSLPMRCLPILYLPGRDMLLG